MIPGMSVGSFKALLFTVFVTVSVTLFSSLSWAAGVACSQVYSQASVYTTSYQSLRDLLVAGYRLVTELQTAKKQVEMTSTMRAAVKEGANARIHEIEFRAEGYFRASKLEFIKQPAVLTLELADGAMDLPYHLYFLKGRPTGDEFSQILYLAETNPLSKNAPPVFSLDLFYELRQSESGAHYEANGGIVAISPRVIESLITGLSTDLHHEILHHFEERKMQLGKQTLARIDLGGGKPKESDPYSESFALDELETHVNDLEKLTDQKRIQFIDRGLSTQVSEEKLRNIQKTRAEVIQRKLISAQEILLHSREGLQSLNDSIERGKYSVVENNSVDFYSLKGSYTEGSIYLNGMPTKKKELKQTLRKVIRWSVLRANELTLRFQRVRDTLKE